jgi:hypothetical protein
LGLLKDALFLIAICALGCHQNYEEGSRPAPIPPQQLPADHPFVPVDQTSKPAPKSAEPLIPGQAVVAGTISVDPSLVARLPKEATLYIIARPAPVGPPLAIKRIPLPALPYAYALTQADAGMMPGQDVDLRSLDALYLSVKIDLDGKVGPAQPGDMEGAFVSNPVFPGRLDADIIISKVH